MSIRGRDTINLPLYAQPYLLIDDYLLRKPWISVFSRGYTETLIISCNLFELKLEKNLKHIDFVPKQDIMLNTTILSVITKIFVPEL